MAGFASGDVDLDDFLRTDALELEDRGVVRTYLALYDGRLVGYESLLADAIRLETNERRKLSLSSGSHPVIPGLKIARLAVDQQSREGLRGIGEALVRFAAYVALDISARIGCRLPIVDAYPDSVGFYDRLGFAPNRAREYRERAHPSMRLDVLAPALPGWLVVG